MEHLPMYICILFALTVLLTVLMLLKAAKYSRPLMAILLCWIVVQSVAGLTGFYTATHTVPPRFLLLAPPPLVLIIGLFFIKKGRKFIDSVDIKILTLLHIVRLPVELTLYALYLHKAVPGTMTFEGRNFDILCGLTAPFVYYFGYVKKVLGRNILIVWNIVCLLLLANIEVIAILSAPFPFQQLAFDQPDMAILYFPFVLLPGCVVPIVLLSHLAAVRQLMSAKKSVRSLTVVI